MTTLFKLQEVVADSTAALESSSINYFELLLKGGVVIYPILFLLLATFYFMLERYMFIKKSAQIDNNYLRTLRDSIIRGDVRSASTLSKSTNLAVSRVLE